MNLKYTMTSREVAELTGKLHKNVLRDIEDVFTQLNFEPSGYLDSYKDSTGRTLKQHRLDRDHVLRDIEKMFEEINAPNFGAVDFLDTYKDAKGETRKQYRLDRDLTMTLVTKYDTARRYAVVRRWRELEGGNSGAETLASTPLTRFWFDLKTLVRDFIQ